MTESLLRRDSAYASSVSGNMKTMNKTKTNMKLLFLLLFTWLHFAGLCATRYVTETGAGMNDGSNWSNAFPSDSLQTAINASGVGDEVWVASGTYYTTSTTTRSISFSMKNDVAVYGSFNGTETLLSQRILTSGLTSILSGEIGVAGIGDNSYHTIHNTGLSNTAIIDGFIIRDANDNRAISLTNGLGGGIYNQGSGAGGVCSPTIRNCIITNNQAGFGAGIFNNGYNGGNASPIIFNCVIANNIATNGGGGMDNFGVTGNANPIITNCVFYNNTALFRAGGMYCWGGSNGNANPIVLNTIFVYNSSVDGGGVVSDRLNLSGGGSSGNSNPNFRNCIFWENTVSGTGPQFYNLGGATFVATYSDIDLTGQTSPHIISGAGTGNIITNPLFTNITLGVGTDGNWMTIDDGLQLQSSSPCIDVGENTGVPTTDVLSNNRVINVVVDIGPYEYQSSTLPIELTDFKANVQNNRVIVNWQTASEINNDFFTIEKSKTATDWVVVSKVNGAGNSSTVLNYSAKDNTPYLGVSYYRLKQTDFDGQFEYSNVKAVNFEQTTTEVVCYPNPTNDQITIKANEQELQSIKIYNALGQDVTNLTKQLSKADHSLIIDLRNLANGLYIVKTLTTANNVYKK